jgi:hypothetical protein
MDRYNGIVKSIEDATGFKVTEERTTSNIGQNNTFYIEFTGGEWDGVNPKTLIERYTVTIYTNRLKSYRQEWLYMIEYIQKIVKSIRDNISRCGISNMRLMDWNKQETDGSNMTIELDFEFEVLRN